MPKNKIKVKEIRSKVKIIKEVSDKSSLEREVDEGSFESSTPSSGDEITPVLKMNRQAQSEDLDVELARPSAAKVTEFANISYDRKPYTSNTSERATRQREYQVERIAQQKPEDIPVTTSRQINPSILPERLIIQQQGQEIQTQRSNQVQQIQNDSDEDRKYKETFDPSIKRRRTDFF